MGSEMCIRDRGLLSRSVSGAWKSTVANSFVDGTVHEIAWVITNCLLYTSDAADDLLCVDLGGRRIIKKKK